MEPLAFLTDPVVAPFAGALAVMLVFLLVEIALTLVAGTGLSHLLGSLAESHWLPDASVVNWLLLKEAPLMMVLVAAIGGFGLSGVAYQLVSLTATGHLAPRLDATIFASLCAVFSVRALGLLFRRFNIVSTTALEPQEFLGNLATVTSLQARQGYAASAKFTDRHGYVHLLMVEPSTAEETFVEGDRVVLCERASASLFRARKP